MQKTAAALSEFPSTGQTHFFKNIEYNLFALVFKIFIDKVKIVVKVTRFYGIVEKTVFLVFLVNCGLWEIRLSI